MSERDQPSAYDRELEEEFMLNLQRVDADVTAKLAAAAAKADDHLKALQYAVAERSAEDLGLAKEVVIKVFGVGIIQAGATVSGEAASPPAPPEGGQFVLSLLAPAERLDEILGMVEETYVKQVIRFGPGRAAVWYWTNLSKTAVHLALRGILAALPFASLFGWKAN